MREILGVSGELTVVHDDELHRYEADLGDGVAMAEYLPAPGGVVFTHTLVPTGHEGQGVGTGLVRSALDDARRRGWRVQARCWFVADFLRRHPEYADLQVG
ncbi:MAG: GNAT family N-acetyltransferase [Acidimicrobiales bacterium]